MVVTVDAVNANDFLNASVRACAKSAALMFGNVVDHAVAISFHRPSNSRLITRPSGYTRMRANAWDRHRLITRSPLSY